MEDNIQISDQSNDKAYFTLVPNYILNHSTGEEQSLYIQMKKFAGDSDCGRCFAGQKTLAVQLGWGTKKNPDTKKVRKVIQKLLKRKWIEPDGVKSGKTHPVKSYKIVDIWKLNVDFYSKKKGGNIPYISGKDKRKGEISPVRKGEISPTNKNHKEEEPITSKTKILNSYNKKLGQKIDSTKNEEPYRLSYKLYDLILKSIPKWHGQPNWDNWASDIKKIHEIDKRSYEEIEEMIEWVQKDKFWRFNILSPDKLRQQFNKLLAQRASKEEPKKEQKKTGSPMDSWMAIEKQRIGEIVKSYEDKGFVKDKDFSVIQVGSKLDIKITSPGLKKYLEDLRAKIKRDQEALLKKLGKRT